MARYRLLITLAIVSLAFATYGDQPVFAPRDPSAARKDFSNVDPSTAIDALNLGTMATEAKTDYVATGTFTGHTGDASDPHGATLTQTTIISDSVDGVDISAHVTDNSDVHGCTAVASASAVADALSAASALIPNNASFTLAGLSTKPFSALTDKPTTLSGYGITDAASSGDMAAHVASTGTSVHGLGTMATEAKTNYVATDTFTAHTGNASNPHSVTYSQLPDAPTFGTMASETATNYVATSTLTAHENDTSTHGVAQVAGIADVSAALSAANASDALNLRLDGSRAMTGNLRLGGKWLSNDGGDEGAYVAADGKVGIGTTAPAATLHVYNSGAAEAIIQAKGPNSSTAYDATLTLKKKFNSDYSAKLYTSGTSTGGAGASLNISTDYWNGSSITTADRIRIDGYSGNVLIGTTTDDGTNKLQVSGDAKIAGTIKSTGAATVGGDLTVTGASTNFRNAVKAVDGAGSGLEADTVPNATPASAAASGVAGSIRYDANYIYICVAANTWKRVAIATW